MGPFKDIGVDLDKTMVATIEIRRPPHNFFDIELIRQIADACEALDQDPACRATVLAAQALLECGPCDTAGAARANVVAVIASVAKRLGNTSAVCRQCYVHPAVLDAYLAGTLAEELPTPGPDGWDDAVLTFLRGRLGASPG